MENGPDIGMNVGAAICFVLGTVRPEVFIANVEPPPPSMWDRIASAAWRGFLEVIAPTLPIIGAAVGYALVRALWP